MTKKYKVLKTQDGRMVAVDKEAEILPTDYRFCEGVVGDKIVRPEFHSNIDNECCNVFKIIFTIGFSLPGIEEIEIVDEAEELANKRFPGDTSKEKVNPETDRNAFYLRLGFIEGYASATKSFTEEDLRKMFNSGFRSANMFEHFEKQIHERSYQLTLESLTRPEEISEIVVGYEEITTGSKGHDSILQLDNHPIVDYSAVKSISATSHSGKVVNVKIKD